MTIAPVRGSSRRAVICGYNRSVDREWLPLFLMSLRATKFTGDVHCVGSFDQQELQLLSQLQCQPHPQSQRPPGLDWENGVHLHMSRVLDQITAHPQSRPDRILMVGTLRAGFLREMGEGHADTVNVFAEGLATIGESEHNVRWLREFVGVPEPFLAELIISSSLVEGPTEAVRRFYKSLFAEFVDRMGLLLVPKVIQGAFNKLCHRPDPTLPITVHANGNPAYFEIWPCYHDIELSPTIKVGGVTPSIIVRFYLGESLTTRV